MEDWVAKVIDFKILNDISAYAFDLFNWMNTSCQSFELIKTCKDLFTILTKVDEFDFLKYS